MTTYDGSTSEQKSHLLIVDDEKANLDLMTLIFKRYYRVTTADSGPRALDLLALPDADYDLVLLDIMMPGMRGVEVLRIIRANEHTHDLPVMLISALGEPADIIQGIRDWY